MRVAIVVGICVDHDAISAAACHQADIIRQLPGVTGVELFTTHLGRPVPCNTHVVANPWELVTNEAFRACDAIIVHWGIYTPLFDALWLVDHTSHHVAVHFHNVTPIALVDEGSRPVIEMSLRQLQTVHALPIDLWTFSEFNRRTLLDQGVAEDRIRFVPFPIEPPRALVPQRPDDITGLLCVGRMVPAKGTHVLIDALALLVKKGKHPYSLTLAGNRALSTDDYASGLVDQIHRLGLDDHVSIVQPTDDELWQLYEASHIVVSPSLHEGLCVPIIEGYLAGCHAVGTTEGNLPFVVQAPDPVVAPNDPIALAKAIESVRVRLAKPSRTWGNNVRRLADQFSSKATSEALREALGLPNAVRG